eukprot:1149578-Pelagomonas_calceolata.AAC.5
MHGWSRTKVVCAKKALLLVLGPLKRSSVYIENNVLLIQIVHEASRGVLLEKEKHNLEMQARCRHVQEGRQGPGQQLNHTWHTSLQPNARLTLFLH